MPTVSLVSNRPARSVTVTMPFGANDFRAGSPRFTPEAMEANQAVVEAVEQLAAVLVQIKAAPSRASGSGGICYAANAAFHTAGAVLSLRCNARRLN
jgi:hypothetical protein